MANESASPEPLAATAATGGTGEGGTGAPIDELADHVSRLSTSSPTDSGELPSLDPKRIYSDLAGKATDDKQRDAAVRELRSLVTNATLPQTRTVVLNEAIVALQALYKQNRQQPLELNRATFHLAAVSSVAAATRSHHTKLDTPVLESLLRALTPYTDDRLDLRLVRAQVVVALVTLIDIDAAAVENVLASIVDDLLSLEDVDSVRSAFTLVALVFEGNPSMGHHLFSQQQLQSFKLQPSHVKNQALIVSALTALSAACVDKQCRALIAQNFTNLIKTALESAPDLRVKLLAACVLVKIRANTETNKKEDADQLDELSELFEDTVSTGASQPPRNYELALEGLAYTSLLPAVKARIVESKPLLESLAKAITHPDKPLLLFPSLNALVNITDYAPKLSQEQKRMRELKNYAGKSALDTVTEPDDVVAARCRKVLDLDIVSTLSDICPRLTVFSQTLVVRLLRNLVTEQKRDIRTKFAEDGGVAILIYLLLPAEKPTDSTKTPSQPQLDLAAKNIAASALARVLISVDPSTVFGPKLKATLAVAPLLTLLQGDASDVPLLDAFEALMALTNLASSRSSQCGGIIARNGNEKILEAVTSSNPMVQRAAVQLVCNLMGVPDFAEGFIDETPQAASRLELLAAFCSSDDPSTQIAATGGLAMLAQWGEASHAILSNKKVVKDLVRVLEDDEFGVMLRALTALTLALDNVRRVGNWADIEVAVKAGCLPALQKLVSNARRDAEEATLASEAISILTG